jgi:hypothetical protein
MMIELVVAENINDRPTVEMISDPIEPLRSDVNVAGQDNNVCVERRHFDRTEFQMQVAAGADILPGDSMTGDRDCDRPA